MSEELTNKPLDAGSNTDPDTVTGTLPVSKIQEGNTEPPHPKKKKKNKKKAEKKATRTVFYGPTGERLSAPIAPQAEPLTEEDSSTSQSLTEAPQTILNLPVKPDEWFIQPAIYDENSNLVAEETLTFLKDGIEVISMPLNEENFSTLSHLLNERFSTPDDSTEADYFHIRKPLSDSEDVDPVMTLTQRNKILATTVLDQKTLKQLIKALQIHVIQTHPVTDWMNRWWKKHKIWRVILIIAAVPFALLFLYSIFWGATH